MNIRRMIMVMAMVGGGVLFVAQPAVAALPSTFAGLVPSTFVDVPGSAIIPEPGVQSASASCPAGTAAVSVDAGDTAGPGGSGGLVSITPGPDYASVVAIGRADRGQIHPQILADVTCAPNAQFNGTTFASRETNVHSATGEWTLTATCPAGMRSFAGGGYFRTRNGTASTDGYFMSANQPSVSGRGWTVSAQDQTFTDMLVVTTRCALQSSSTTLLEVTYPVVPIPGTGVGRADGYAHCPASYLPISGGAALTQDGSATSAHPQLVYSVRVRNGQIGWHAAGFSGGEHARLHVIVLCGR